MSLLERMNNWCGDVLNMMVKYDDLITVGLMSILFLLCVFALVYVSLGYLK